MQNRIKNTFSKLKEQNKTAFISFVTGGDPDLQTSLEIIKELPNNGTDLIEIGIPFLDPSADGPAIDLASKRAVKNGATLKKLLELVKEFRKENNQTPIILMGYYNSVLHYGLERFTQDANKNGVDGLLIVDLPIEEDDELNQYCKENSLNLIKLITPTSSKQRMEQIIKKASGFIYFVSIAGITGTKSSNPTENSEFIKQIKQLTDIPVAIGFGIKTKDHVKQMSNIGAHGVVVGSKLVSLVEEGIKNNLSQDKIKNNLLQANKELSSK